MWPWTVSTRPSDYCGGSVLQESWQVPNKLLHTVPTVIASWKCSNEIFSLGKYFKPLENNEEVHKDSFVSVSNSCITDKSMIIVLPTKNLGQLLSDSPYFSVCFQCLNTSVSIILTYVHQDNPMDYLDEYSAAASHRLALPASLDLLFQASQTVPPCVQPQRKFCQRLRVCVWEFSLSPPAVWEGGRGHRERETDKLEASKSAAALCNRSKDGVQRSVHAAGSSASGEQLVSAAREEETTEKRCSKTRLDHNRGKKGGEVHRPLKQNYHLHHGQLVIAEFMVISPVILF